MVNVNILTFNVGLYKYTRFLIVIYNVYIIKKIIFYILKEY